MSQQYAGAWPPTPEQLAAYVDGELEAASRRQVEQWLATHPEAAAEVEAQRRLLALWRKLPACEPAEVEWAATLTRILAACETPARPVVGQRLAWTAAALTALAATVALALLGGPSRRSETHPRPQLVVVPAVEPLPVTTSAAVEIISMDAADASLLVIGQPPVNEPLVLAAAGEIQLDKLEPDEDGMVPLFADAPGPDAPMIVVPATPRGGRDP
jgi:anti-sigma factor RsiW